MLATIDEIIFYPDFYADFHGAAKDAVNRRAQNHEIAHANRHQEIEVIDGSGDHVLTGVAMCGHCSRQVNPMHEASTEKRAQGISVIRQHYFRHFRLGVAN